MHHLLLLSSNKDPSLGLATFLGAATATASTSAKGPIADKAKQQRLQMLANYYQKCTRIFLMSGATTTTSSSSSSMAGGGGALFHAAAWMRYWTVINLLDTPPPKEELTAVAGQVVASALAVPITSSNSPTSSSNKTSRLTALLGLSTLPTRKGLLSQTVKSGALELSPPAIKKLHELLVVSFDPLSLGGHVATVLDEIAVKEEGKEEGVFAPYIPLLERAVLSRLMKHLGEVYESIKLPSVYELVAPLVKRSDSEEGEVCTSFWKLSC